MKYKLKLLVSLLFFFFTTQVQSNPIDKINFIGLINSSESALIKVLPIKVGEDYSDSKSNEIIASLFETGLFSDIKITKNNNVLEITVKENPYIKYFEASFDSEFNWNSFLSPQESIFSKDEINEFAS